MPRDPAEQLLRRLHDQASLSSEVARAKDRERIDRERRRHLRTIRFAARSRNRSRPHLAWLILVALGLLILVATRAASAAPPDGAVEKHETEGSEDADQESDGPDARTNGEDDLAEPRTNNQDDLDGGLRGSWADSEDNLADPDRLAELLEDASIEDPLVRDAIETGVVFSSTAFADAAELADVELRQRPSWFGRLDLTIAWRRGYHGLPLALDGSRVAAHESMVNRRIDDTFLLVATWRI